MSGKSALVLLALALAVAACKSPDARSSRATVRKVTGNTIELVPEKDQLPFCLVFTVSQSGVIRQLTMTRENKSVKCEEGKPIGGVSYRIPVDEGTVRAHVFFSDQKLNAASVAQQVLEIRDNPSWSQLDLRLPGRVNMEVLEFVPSGETAAATVGGVISDAGEVQQDGGAEAPVPAGADAGATAPP